MNKKGQFSIIAALLVAVILITTVIVTYSTIRNSPVRNQPPILNAIDEINLAIKQVLGFTVGYYGSILQVTGNVSYANQSATNYLQSGLQNIANMHPEWGTSINLNGSALQVYWFSSTSYSSGNLTVNYDLPGLGILGVSYQTSCQLGVQTINTTTGQACLNVTQDQNQPLVTLGMQNFNFYNYDSASSAWKLVNPNTEPTAYANGTYYVNLPSGINPYSYLVQVADQRGIIVVASSYNSYTSTLAWNSTSVQASSPSAQYYVNNYNSSVDSLPDIGTHSNFNAQKNTDSVYDNMTEGDVPIISTAQTYVQTYSTNTQIGTWSNFTAEQYSDGIYDTLTEANSTAGTPWGQTNTWVQNNGTNVDGTSTIGTWSNFTQQKYTDTLNDTLTEGNVPVTSTSSFGNAVAGSNYQSISASYLWGGAFTSPAYATSVYNITIYGRSSSGTINTKAVICDSTGHILTNGVSNVVGVTATAGWQATFTFGTPPTISGSTSYALMIIPTSSSIRLYYSSTSGGAERTDNTNSYTTPTNPTDWVTTGTHQDCIYANCSLSTPNYKLNLQENWTSAVFNEDNTRLCIRTGPLDAEAILVHYWTGSTWAQISAGLSANQWNNFTITSYLSSASFTIRFSDGIQTGDTSQSTWQIESVLINSWNATNYQLSLEEQWPTAPYRANLTKTLCIKTGAYSTAELLRLDWWNTTSSAWLNINSSLVSNAWNNITVTNYLTASNFTIRFSDGTPSGDTVQSTWQIECVLLYTQNSTDNYQLDLEEQWNNVNYTNAQLCIKTGAFSGTEAIKVDVWNDSAKAWTNVLGGLNAAKWNNVTVTGYLQSSNFTIRFMDTNENSDPVQDMWQIDATLLTVYQTVDLYSLSQQGTIVVELLQNGTMRWLGQSVALANSSSTLPFPPVPVKSIHVNETINGVNSQVPFQVEDWSSAYHVPLGLTSNMSIFSSRTMLVFLATPNTSKVTIWWNGSDTATQTSYAYTNRYFSDSPSSGKLSNGLTTLQFQGNFVVNSTVGNSSSTANFMRINSNVSSYGSLPSYVITSGVVRDIIHQEAEWPPQTSWSAGGVINCSDIYADIVLTLPANATYYTYQLSLMFVQSQQSRTINDLCPVWLTSLTGQVQTENGTTNGLPNVSNASDLFYNYSASTWAHHWSQSISGTNGTGIMFTDNANQNLYLFDNINGTRTGALGADSTAQTIQLLPVNRTAVSFGQTLDPRMQDIIWYGAIATFNATTTPIYNNADQTGLWIFVEYPPTVAVTGENNQLS